MAKRALFWSSADLACNQTGTMCRLFDGEELHVRCVMMFKRELLESHYMAQGTDWPAAYDVANLRYSYQDILDAWLDGVEWPEDARV